MSYTKVHIVIIYISLLSTNETYISSFNICLPISQNITIDYSDHSFATITIEI